MNRRTKEILCLVTLTLVSACSTVSNPEPAQGKASVQDPTRIQLNQPLHFSAPDGTDVVVPAGTYRVEQAGDSQLRLVSTADASPTLISAHAMPSAPDVPTPVALGTRLESDAYDLVFLLPGGTALEAHGSESGVLARGFGVKSGIALMAEKSLLLQLDPQVQPKPDLVPTCLNISEVNLGVTYLYFVSGGVRNQGAAVAGPSQGTFANVTFPVPTLQPGQLHTFTIGPNTWQANLRVDSANQVGESNEQNNSGNTRC